MTNVHCSKYSIETFLVKGTVSGDFRPLVFSSNNTLEAHDTWAIRVSNIDSYSKYSTTKIANFQLYSTKDNLAVFCYVVVLFVTKAETLLF
jgi:hypothetical protein